MTPASIPSAPPLLSTATAGTDALALFRHFNRDTFRAAFGVEAPIFDPTRPAKDWFDSSLDTSDIDNVGVYKVARKGGIHQMVVPAREAAQINLPGNPSYPPYMVAATSAVRRGPGDLTPQPVNADYLSTHDQALQLMGEVGGTAVVPEQPMGGGFAISYPPGEPRSMWNITFNGRNVNAGLLLKNRNANGVGAPGHWDLGGEEPAWVPKQLPPFDNSTVYAWREIPIRDLLPNEALRVTLMGVEVVRTDMLADAVTAAGTFGPNEQKQLAEMYAWFTRMGHSL